jgi:hypothetical protein
MTSPFPKQLVEMIRKRVERSDIFYGKQENPYLRAYDTAVHGRDFFNYGFHGSMYTGNFAPYEHEMSLDGYVGFNCTTIIPSLYTYCDIFGLEPKIVQFAGFRDIGKTKKAKEEPNPILSSHFGLFIKVKGQDYFLDPYHSRFGRVKEITDSYMEIGKSKTTKAAKREFKELVHYTPEQFVEMMDHFRTPEGSLEMLIAGQRMIGKRYYGGFRNCEIMLHYFDDINEVRVRLEIPQPDIQDKVVYNHIFFNDNGEMIGQSTELLVTERPYWDDLIDHTSIAKGNLSSYKSIDDLLKGKVDIRTSERLGPILLQQENHDLLRHIIKELLTDFLQRTPKSDALKRMILARTLYETESPEKEYLFNEETRTASLKKVLKRWRDMGTKFTTHPDEIERIDRSVGLVHEDIERGRRIKRITRARSKRQREIDYSFGPNGNLRADQRQKHDRLMDMVLYAKQLGEISVDELEEKAKQRNVNPDIGYLAIVADFVPSIVDAEKLLTLEPFMDDIKAKVKARRAAMKQS